MKQKNYQERGKTHTSLMPQKWLLCLLTLLVTFVGSGRMAATKVTWTASNTTYTAEQELSNDTALVSVRLGTGNWTYNADRDGITNTQQGSPSADPAGAYIVVTPNVDIAFKLSTYSSQSNCNLRMYDSANPTIFIKDFRQRGSVADQDFGVLKAGHTYYIYGDEFKNEYLSGGLEYVFFKSFTATDFIHPISTTGTIGEADLSSGFAQAFSPYYQLDEGKERSFSFKVRKNPFVDNESFVNPADLDGKTFVIANSNATQLLCCTGDNHDLAVQNVQSLSDDDYYYVKFARVTDASVTDGNLYTMQLLNANGQNFTKWGTEGFVNFQPNGQNKVFALGLTQNGPYGQDVENGGLWDVTYENEKGYVIKNVARNMYLNPSVAAPSAEKVYTRFFTSKPSPFADAWNSFVLMATANEDSEEAPYNYGINDDIQHLVLRPDNFGWGAAYNGYQSNLALVDGVLNWNTFKNDLNGATVNAKVSFNDDKLFIYWTIENNGRKYTYFYSTKNNITDASVQLYFSVDKSQITDFVAKEPVPARRIVTQVEDKDKPNEINDDMGIVVITNEDGVNIPSGASLGDGTTIFVTATAKDGYLFVSWSNNLQTARREYVVGTTDEAQHTFHAYFDELSDYENAWNLTTTVGDLYYENGTPWRKTENTTGPFYSDNMSGDFDGAYIDANGKPMLNTEGLLFNKSVRLSRKGDSEIILFSWGTIKIPVIAGEIVYIKIKTQTAARDVEIVNSDGTSSTVTVPTSYTNIPVVAAQNGYVTLIGKGGDSGRNHYVDEISKSRIYDFTFVDGTSVAAMPGSQYTNFPTEVDGLPALAGATYQWTSSNPSEVRVDPNTGEVTINQNFSGNVQITATRLAMGNYPALARSYTLTTATSPLYFEQANFSVELSSDGVATPDLQLAKGGADGAEIKYTTTTTAKYAEVTEDANGNGWKVTINGAGRTTVTAKSGALTASYTIDTYGLAFENNYDIYRFDANGQYTQNIDGIDGETYEIIEKIGEIAKEESITINGSTGTISGLPTSQDDNKGGAIVVKATKDSKESTYVLTIPYKTYVWNFYKEGLTLTDHEQTLVEGGDNKNHYTLGTLVEKGNNPWAADEVKLPETQQKQLDTYDTERRTIEAIKENERTADQKTRLTELYTLINTLLETYLADSDAADKTTYEINDKTGDKTNFLRNISKRHRWRNLQLGATNTQPYYYWDYTFKTIRRLSDKKTIYYTNEPLFSYKHAVNGNNARVIKNTQGLVFNCAANKFGINDNSGCRQGQYDDVSEEDRAILFCGYSSLTIPQVQKGYYVKLHWYRHSDNAGDQFRVTNALDLDGREINPNDVLRFTGSHMTHHNYMGTTILQAAETGDITITIANNNWTELYRIEVMDTYSTDLQLAEVKINGKGTGDISTGTEKDNERDVNDPNWYNTTGHDKTASLLVSRIKTNAKNRERISYAPDFYFTGYPGNCYSWNGWQRVTVQAECEGSAKLAATTDADTQTPNVIAKESARVGASRYPMFHMQQIEGTGAIKVTFRVHTGWGAAEIAAWNASHKNDPILVDQEPHYTLNKQEAWVAAGEYSVQEYPYTWDFTKYNMDRTNAYNAGKTLDAFSLDYVNVANEYGSWNNEVAMQAAEPQDQDGKYAYIGIPKDGNKNSAGVHRILAEDIRHKRFFAQGAQLTIGEGTNRTILESEGLRINIASVNDANDGKVKWSGTYVENTAPAKATLTVNNDLHMLEGNAKQRKAPAPNPDYGWTKTSLTVNGTITVPEVYNGMYVFVRSAVKPTSVSGATDMNDAEIINSVQDDFKTDYNSTEDKVTMKQDQMIKEGDMKTWVYKVKSDDTNYSLKYININTGETADPATQTGAEFKYVSDVTITPATDCKIEGIGVTDEFKMMTNGDGWATDSRASRIDYSETAHFTKSILQPYITTGTPVWNENDKQTHGYNDCGWIETKEVNVIASAATTGEANRGLILEDQALSGDTKAFNAERRLIPLFVPACNVDDDDISGNSIVHNFDKKDIEIDNNHLFYVFTNKFFGAAYNGATIPNNATATVAADYSWYNVRQTSTLRSNAAYLKVDKNVPVNARMMFMFIGGSDEETETVGIDDVVSVRPENGEIYTLSGTKINGIPTQRGIYIMNGKKVFIK